MTLGPVAWWGVALLVAAPLVIGTLVGIMIDAGMHMIELRRRGEHRRETDHPPPGV